MVQPRGASQTQWSSLQGRAQQSPPCRLSNISHHFPLFASKELFDVFLMISSDLPPKGWLRNMPHTLAASNFCLRGFSAQTGAVSSPAGSSIGAFRAGAPLCTPSPLGSALHPGAAGQAGAAEHSPSAAAPVPASTREHQHVLACRARHCTKNRAPPLYCYTNMFCE